MNKLLFSSLSTILGGVLVALAILPGPLGVPGYLTYQLCTVNPLSGGGCIYYYTLDVFAGGAGVGLIATGVIIIVRSFRKPD
jgi:hypothetical protein